MSRFPLRGLALVVALISAPACYRYVPVEIGAVPPGEDIRLRMSREGGEQLARVLESAEIQLEVSGRYEGMEQGSVLIRVPVVRDPTGVRPTIQQVVRLPETGVLTVDLRELSVAKTAGIVAAGVAVVGFLVYDVFEVFSDSGGNGPDTELSLIPLFQALFGGR